MQYPILKADMIIQYKQIKIQERSLRELSKHKGKTSNSPYHVYSHW
jgi:hypothetical protein